MKILYYYIMSSPWLAHVKAYQKKNGGTYKSAMSKAAASYKGTPTKNKKPRPAQKGKGSVCAKNLCSKGIANASDFKKYSLRNHPDRPGSNKDPAYSTVAGCYASERKKPGWCDRELEEKRSKFKAKEDPFGAKPKGLLDRFRSLFGRGPRNSTEWASFINSENYIVQ